VAVWRLIGGDGARRVALIWREHDGPPIERRGRESFGSRLIRRSVEYELEGTVAVSFDRAGLRCAIEFPMRDTTDQLASDEPGSMEDGK
jgi:two-component sensor histidine kinase